VVQTVTLLTHLGAAQFKFWLEHLLWWVLYSCFSRQGPNPGSQISRWPFPHPFQFINH